MRYVKNQSLGFTIPYTLNGEEKQYYPDFIAQMSPSARRVGPSGPTEADLLNVIVEVTGEARKDKAAKVTTARTLWVPAVNNHGGFGRWAFVEVNRPVGRTAHDWGGSCAGSQAGRSGRVKRRKRASASTFGAFGGSHHVYGHSAIPELINLQDVGGRSTVPASGAVTVCRRGDGAILRSFRIRIVFGAFSSSATKSRALGSSSVAKDLWLKAFEMC